MTEPFSFETKPDDTSVSFFRLEFIRFRSFFFFQIPFESSRACCGRKSNQKRLSVSRGNLGNMHVPGHLPARVAIRSSGHQKLVRYDTGSIRITLIRACRSSLTSVRIIGQGHWSYEHGILLVHITNSIKRIREKMVS